MSDQQLEKKQPDFIILILAFILTGFGLVMVYSASHVHAYFEFGDSAYFFKRQLAFVILGLFGMFVTMNIPFIHYKKFVPLILFGLLAVMILVLIPGIGSTSGGAQRWLNLGFTRIQPAEFVKLGLMIYLASIYSKKQQYINDFYRGVVPPLVVVAVFFILILLQRDLGTGMSIIFFTMVMIFCSGAQFKHMFGLSFVTAIIFLTFALTQSYRVERLTSFIDPWADRFDTGYQLTQSLIAIGNGGLTGNGIGNSVQKFLYLPDAHTDFIFAIVAEEVGLIGVILLLSCLVLFIIRGIRAAVRCPDSYGTLLGMGIASMIGIQAMINIAVAAGRLPVTGIPLPFISYGGSSLLLTLLSVGILLNISRYQETK
jgi:cell division protein FtsW